MKEQLVYILVLLFITNTATANVNINNTELSIHTNNINYAFSSNQSYSSITTTQYQIYINSHTFKITPSSGNINVTINEWNTTGNYAKNWTENATVSNATSSYVIGLFPARNGIVLYKDGGLYDTIASDSNGYIYFNYIGGYNNNITFNAVLSTPAESYVVVTCSDVIRWGEVGFSLLSLLFIVIAGSYAVGWINGNKQLDSRIIYKYTMQIILSVVVGLIGFSVLTQVFNIIPC